MGCNCGGRKSGAKATTWTVTTSSGEQQGPFLTQTEARIALQRAGGGTMAPSKV